MMYIESLALEITRKCSCACSHCLRGDSAGDGYAVRAASKGI